MQFPLKLHDNQSGQQNQENGGGEAGNFDQDDVRSPTGFVRKLKNNRKTQLGSKKYTIINLDVEKMVEEEEFKRFFELQQKRSLLDVHVFF
mmetsp:Transcript_33988/g.30770  ORF Transcript_33988/g.30770 Transcript_33988/m.30770 type:complete len:91 (-) Transcript_33988:1403-1675(-)